LGISKLTGWTWNDIADMTLHELLFWQKKSAYFQERINEANAI